MRKIIIPISCAYLPTSVINAMQRAADEGNTSAQNALNKYSDMTGDSRVHKKEPAQREEKQQPAQQQSQQQSQPAQQQAQPAAKEPETVQETTTQNTFANIAVQPVVQEAKKQEETLPQYLHSVTPQDLFNNTNKTKVKEDSLTERIKNTDGRKYTFEQVQQAEDTIMDDEIPRDTCDIDLYKYKPNVKFNVNKIDTSNYKSAVGDNVEILAIVDGKGINDMTSTDGKVHSIGRDSLVGADENAQYVIRNKETGELFQYSVSEELSNTMDRIDKLNYKAYMYATTGKQQIAALELEMEHLNDEYLKICEEFGKDPAAPNFSDTELAMAQPLIDKYAELENKKSQEYDKYMGLWERCSNMAEELRQHTGNSTVDISDYITAQKRVERYNDYMAMQSGDMSRKDFNKKWSASTSTWGWKEYAESAIEGQQVLDECDGSLYDRDSVITNDLNGYVQQMLDDEKMAEQSLEDAKTLLSQRLNMEDDSQVNSIGDVLRNSIARTIDGVAEYGRIKPDPVAFISDLAELSEVWENEWNAGKNEEAENGKWSLANLNTGATGIIMNELNDGNALIHYVPNLIYAAAAFKDKHYDYGTGFITDVHYEFNDKVFKDHDKYQQQYLDRGGKFIDAVVAYNKAVLEGNADPNAISHAFTGKMEDGRLYDKYLTTTVEATGVNDTVNISKDMAEKHPTACMIADVMLDLLTDPTIYTTAFMRGGARAITETATSLSDDAARKVVQEISYQTGIEIDKLANTEKQISKMYQKSLVRALEEVDNFRASDNWRAVQQGLKNADVQEWLKTTEASKALFIEDVVKGAEATINTLATNPATAEIWKEVNSAIKFTQSVETLDKTLNTLQLGAIGIGGKAIKGTAKSVKNVISTTGLADGVQHSIAIGKTKMAAALAKLDGRDLESIGKAVTITEGSAADTTIDIMRTAVREGKQIPLEAIEEINQATVDLRADYVGAVVRDNMRQLYSNIREVSTADTFFSTSTKGMSTRQLVDTINTFGRMSVDKLDDITRAYNGMGYKEYVAYLRKLTDGVDYCAGFAAKRPVTAVLNRQLDNIEKYVTAYNNKYMRMQVSALYSALAEHSDDAIRALKDLDLSYAAPDLQAKYAEVVDTLLYNQELAAEIDAVRTANAAIAERNKAIYEATSEYNELVRDWNTTLLQDNERIAQHNKRVSEWNKTIKEYINGTPEERAAVFNIQNSLDTERVEYNNFVREHNKRVRDWNATVRDSARESRENIYAFNTEAQKHNFEILNYNVQDVTEHNRHVDEWNAAARDKNKQLFLELHPEERNDVLIHQAQQRASEQLNSIADRFEGIVKAHSMRDGIAYIPAPKPSRHDEVQYATATDFVNAVFAQAGATPTQEQLDKVLSTSVQKLIKDGNVEMAGTFYTFKESAEANLCGIINNKVLDALEENTEFLADVTTVGLDKYLPQPEMRHASKVFTESLSNYGVNTGLEYHAMMDAFSGGYERINSMARKWNSTLRDDVKIAIEHDIAEYIYNKANSLVKSATGVEEMVDGELHFNNLLHSVRAALGEMDADSLGIVVSRNSYYSGLAALSIELKSNPELLRHVDTLNEVLNDVKYTSNNNTLGMVMSSEALTREVEAASGIKGFKPDYMKALWEVTQNGEVSLGLRKIIDTDRACEWFKRDYIKSLEGCDTILTELQYYINDLNDLMNKMPILPCKNRTEVNNLAKIVVKACEGTTDAQTIKYLDWYKELVYLTLPSTMEFNEDGLRRANVALVDIIERLGINVEVYDDLCPEGMKSEWFKYSRDWYKRSSDYVQYKSAADFAWDSAYVQDALRSDFMQFKPVDYDISGVYSGDYLDFRRDFIKYEKAEYEEYVKYSDKKFKRVELPEEWSFSTQKRTEKESAVWKDKITRDVQLYVNTEEAHRLLEYKQMKYTLQDFAEYSRDTERRSNWLDVRRAAVEMLNPDDTRAVAQFEAQAQYYDELYSVYSSFNDGLDLCTDEARANIIKQYCSEVRTVEKDLFSANRLRVLSYSNDELNSMLLNNGMNAVVFSNKDADALAWATQKVKEGYIVTDFEIGGQSYKALSMDLTQYSVQDIDMYRNSKVARQSFSTPVVSTESLNQRIADAYYFNKTKLGVDWELSCAGTKNEMSFYDMLQSKLPIECRLDATYRQQMANGYMSNVLTTPIEARQMGAIKGNLMTSWYYTAVGAAQTVDEISDIVQCMNTTGNKLSTQLTNAGIDLADTEAIHKLLQNGDYHIVRLKEVFRVGEARELSIELLDDIKDYTNFGDALIMDNEVYRYCIGEVKSNNSALKYLLMPEALTAVADIASSVRSSFITGMLYGANILGTGMRNIVDSCTKMMNEMGLDVGCAKHWLSAVNDQSEYVKLYSTAMSETGLKGTEAIYEYARMNPNIDVDQLVKWHAAFTVTATADDEVAKVMREINNKRLVDALGFKATNDDYAVINEAFNKYRDGKFRWVNRNRRTDTQEFADLYTFLQNELRDSFDADQIREIANRYGAWEMGNTEHWYTKLFNGESLGSRGLCLLNKKVFDDAEVRARNAMLLTMLDEGDDALRANKSVVKTQFDYNLRLGASNLVDTLMPFSKYQFANAAYWLDCYNYSAFAGSNIRRLAEITGYGKNISTAFKQQFAYNYMHNLYGDNEYALNDANEQLNALQLFTTSMKDTIDGFKGTPDIYTNGGLSVSDHRFIKIGNGFMDTMDWLVTAMTAPVEIANGKIPTIIQDHFFSPVMKLYEHKDIVDDLIHGNWDSLYEYNARAGKADKNKQFYADMCTLIPVYGMLFNTAVTAYKNITANKSLFAMTYVNTDCKNELLKSIGIETASIGFGLLNACIGLKYDTEVRKVFVPYVDENGNTVTWKSLSDEEKKKYIYNPIYSQPTTWYTTPSALTGLYGRLARLGLSREDIKMLTDKTKYNNQAYYVDNNGHGYFDAKLIEVTVIDMLAQGFSIEEIKYLLTVNCGWYDFKTREIINSSSRMEQELMNKAFLYGYSQLPEYIRYQPEQYQALMERYKSMGFDTYEAWYLMSKDTSYIDAFGCMIPLNDEQVKAYNKWVKNEYYEGQEDDGFLQWYATLPEYIQYEKGAYSRTRAYLRQMFDEDTTRAMIQNGAYYTVDGRLINCSDMRRAKNSSGAFQDANGYWHKAGSFQDELGYWHLPTDFEVDGYWFHKGDNPYLGMGSFENYWNALPDYLRFTKGEWSKTNKVLKEAGFDYNTRMQAMLDGAWAMEIDPNAEYFQQLLANQKMVAVTETIYVDKEVPLRECSLDKNGNFVWNGPQVIQCTDLGNGVSLEQQTVTMERAAGVSAKWKDYDAAMVTVKVPKTVVTLVQDDGQVFGRVVSTKDGETYLITQCPEYQRKPHGYYTRGGGRKGYNNDNYKLNRRFTPKYNKRLNRYLKYRGKRYKNFNIYNNGYYNGQPMHIKYSNVRTYSKQHFLYQQGLGYQYWMQWGDGRITNHVNRNGRRTLAPSTYRNPIAKSRNMYKELYGKYGASRMNQRQNIKSYSNGSVTRLRRNDLRNRAYNIRQAQLRVK